MGLLEDSLRLINAGESGGVDDYIRRRITNRLSDGIGAGQVHLRPIRRNNAPQRHQAALQFPTNLAGFANEENAFHCYGDRVIE